MITRITSTDKADKLIDELREVHGDLMFHQSGGCCDGSAPMCFPKGEFYLGNSDVEVGIVNNVPFYMSAEHHIWLYISDFNHTPRETMSQVHSL